MAITVQGASSGIGADVGGSTFKGLHVHVKPLEYGSLGHYTYAVRIGSTAAQAANSRLLELRNTHATNLIIPTRLQAQVLQTAAGTAQENSIDAYKLTNFSAVDTTNATTPTVSVKRGSMAAAPGGAAVRHLSGAAAGMTGGTLTKDSSPFFTLPYNVQTAIQTQPFDGAYVDFVDNDDLWSCPFVFAQNEGFDVENRVLNVTSYGVTWYFKLAWAEVTAF